MCHDQTDGIFQNGDIWDSATVNTDFVSVFPVPVPEASVPTCGTGVTGIISLGLCSEVMSHINGLKMWTLPM